MSIGAIVALPLLASTGIGAPAPALPASDNATSPLIRASDAKSRFIVVKAL
ncbi:MAG TPA: hypothetical protein VFW46_21785 [Stellaceae bacterium]|nr:hypothetical protein [Stellaceae bacterium]